MTAFRRCFVMTYFAKEYSNQKIIGKGTFARVLQCQRNSDGKEFAVKTFDKAALKNSK